MKQKKLGLALGSGAARGFAHLGVLQALGGKGDKNRLYIRVQHRALIGALYCSGMSVLEIVDLAVGIEPWEWIDISVPKGVGTGTETGAVNQETNRGQEV